MHRRVGLQEMESPKTVQVQRKSYKLLSNEEKCVARCRMKGGRRTVSHFLIVAHPCHSQGICSALLLRGSFFVPRWRILCSD